jgi:ketosteroid isomerase-like protein
MRGMGGARLQGASDIQEIQVLGDWAWMRSRLEIAVTRPDGAIVRRAGSTLSILRRTPAGAWVIVRDANLLSAAPP